jgi:glycosyltransferase involved in cell wall biosynthesis
MTPVSVVFLGIGVMPYRVAGDKNFLLDLARYLDHSHVSTHFISISENYAGNQDYSDNITFIPRSFHNKPEKFFFSDSNGKPLGYHHQHGLLRESAELSLTLTLAAPRLRQVLQGYSLPIVHWSDLAVMMPLVRLACGPRARYVCSALRYVPQRKAANLARAQALRSADAIITSTQAAKDLWVRDGCDPQRIFVSPWGYQNTEKYDENAHYTFDQDKIRLIWSGFIQQIGEADFNRTLAVAREVVKARTDIEFTFCFKPESFREEYLGLQQPNIVIKKGERGFVSQLVGYDAFISPISRGDSSVAPPLTWIESLSVGLPLMTTRVLGVDELLTNGQSAIICDDYRGLESWLLETRDLHDRLHALRAGALAQFATRYSMDVVGAKYLAIYEEVSAK